MCEKLSQIGGKTGELWPPRRNLKNGKREIGVFSENQKGWQVMLWSTELNKKINCMLVLIKWVNTLTAYGLQQATICRGIKTLISNSQCADSLRLQTDLSVFCISSRKHSRDKLFSLLPGWQSPDLSNICMVSWKRAAVTTSSSFWKVEIFNSKHSEQPHWKKAKWSEERQRAALHSVLIDRNIRSTNNSAGARIKNIMWTQALGLCSTWELQNMFFLKVSLKLGAVLDVCMPVCNSPLFRHSMSDTATDVVHRGARSRIQFSLCFPVPRLWLHLLCQTFTKWWRTEHKVFIWGWQYFPHFFDHQKREGAVLARRSPMWSTN